MKRDQKLLPVLISVLIVSGLLLTIGGANARETIFSMPDDGLIITADSGNATRMGAWVDEVIITVEPDPEQAVLKLGAGEIDLYASVQIDHTLLDDIAAHPEIDYDFSYGNLRDLRLNTYRNPHTKAPLFEDGRLNPFAIPEIREAMNRLIDRDHIVDEYLGGRGVPIWTHLLPGFPDHGFHYDIVEDIEEAYAHDFSAAKAVFDTQMPLIGATWKEEEELWYYEEEPVEIIVIIRSDVPPFPGAGHYVADQLEALGFEVTRLIKSVGEAWAIWSAGDPAEGLFHIATGAWGIGSPLRLWDHVFDQMYTHRVYGGLWAILEEQLEEFTTLDEASWRLRFKEFASMDERKALLSTALTEAMRFSNCIWVTEASLPHAYRHNVALAADLGAGILGQAWPHTVHFRDTGEPVAGGTLNVALPRLLTEPWNPVGGGAGIGAWEFFPTFRALGDAGILVDPRDGLRHPLRVESATVTVCAELPVRSSLPWVTLEEVSDPIQVPDDAWVDWNAENQVFVTAAEKKAMDTDWDQTALTRSVVVYPSDIFGVHLHDGSTLSLGDFVMALIMRFDRGKPESPIHDASIEGGLVGFLDIFKGVEIIHDGLGAEPLTIATYLDTWSLDAELTVTTWFPTYAWGDTGSTGFWHMITVGWLAEEAGELAFSGWKAGNLDVPWMDYARGDSLPILEYWMDWAADVGFIPYEPTLGQYIDTDEITERWANLQDWYAEMGHFWVSNGPFYLYSVAEDPPEVVLKRFEDYPDPADRWLFLMSNALNIASTEGGSVVHTGEADTLTITTTGGGSVRSPGEGAFSFDPDTVVALVAEVEDGYEFVNWTGYVWTVADPNSPSTTITIQDHYYVTANFAEIPSEEIPAEEITSLCFIATAAYGTPMAEEIQVLREFRDGYLMTNPPGQAFVDFYYRNSPPIAEFITEHPWLKPIVRTWLTPAVAMSTVVVNTSPLQKGLVLGLIILSSVSVAAWTARRRQRHLQHG